MISRRSLFGLFGGVVAGGVPSLAATDKPWVSVYADAVNELVLKEASPPMAIIYDGFKWNAVEIECVSMANEEWVYLVKPQES